MTTETVTRYCPFRIWTRGMDRACGVSVGLSSWEDSTGQERVACRHHEAGLRRRYPESLPDEFAQHGTLGLATPWARAAFSPADRIAIENLIPFGYVIGVTGDARGRGRVFTLWALDPDRRELMRHAGTHDPQRTARYIAQRLTELTEPEWPGDLPPDPITEAKKEAERVESWTLADDFTVMVPLDYTRTEA